MAYWDSVNNRIIYAPVRTMDDYPGWFMVDCGCCAGLQWSGEEPRECDRCEGNAAIAYHIKSRRMALYPGGPFRGSYAISESIAFV